MLEIKGEYNTAHVMIDTIDATTRSQIQNFVNNPSFAGSRIAIMPDCHAGAGSCIGFTMRLNGRVIPDVVGVDIGCAMLSAKFDVSDLDLARFDAYIKEFIPAGFAVNDKVYRGQSDDLFADTAERVGADVARVMRSIGTLGGGNHFIEAGYGGDGKLWVTIHTGSRSFGLKIANYHSKKAKDLCEKHKRETRGMPYLLINEPEGYAYMEDQMLGVEFAEYNRFEIMNRIEKFIKKDPIAVIESRHNLIDSTDMIRKGATSAALGEPVIIPFNMRDGIAICRGLGNPLYNFSAPHGAGRILSRSKAKEQLDVATFKKEMADAGVYTTTACLETLDEAPGAYKDKDTIIAAIKDTVEIIELIKPVYNFKAGGE